MAVGVGLVIGKPGAQAGRQIEAPNTFRFSASVQFVTPSLHEQVLHELSPVSFPDQPLGTISPPDKVHFFSSGVGVLVGGNGGGKIDVAVAWANRVPTIDGGVAGVPSGPGVFLEPISSVSDPDVLGGDGRGVRVGDGLGVRVGDGLGVLVDDGRGVLLGDGLGVLVAGTTQGPTLLHPSTPSVHEHTLQKLFPVSFPDQPFGTISPPDKVHIGTTVAVLVAVGGSGVSVGITGVSVGIAGVSVGITGMSVGGTLVGVAVAVEVGVGVEIVNAQVFDTRLVSKDASVATPAAMLTETVPSEDPFSTSNVYVVPDPAKLLAAGPPPFAVPETVISPTTKSLTDSANVTVNSMVLVLTVAPHAPVDDVIVTAGPSWTMLYAKDNVNSFTSSPLVPSK